MADLSNNQRRMKELAKDGRIVFRGKPTKKKWNPFNHDPVVDQNKGKYTEIRFNTYTYTSGIIMRNLQDSEFVGICQETPLDVLDKTFANYLISEFNCHDFEINDGTNRRLGYGLSLARLDPKKEERKLWTGRVERNIEGFFDTEPFQRTKRNEVIPKLEVESIIDHIDFYERNICGRTYAQDSHNIEQVVKVLEKYK